MNNTLITGIIGQDGAYLVERLLAKGSEVHGVTCRTSTLNPCRIVRLYRVRMSTSGSCTCITATWPRAGGLSTPKHLIGWEPQDSPEEGFKRTVEWHVQNRALLENLRL